jgi:predicted methyltransferase
MSLLRATTLAHALIRAALRPGDTAIDATVGNGHDTVFLADLVGPRGRVIGFDVQPMALAAARARLTGRETVELIEAGHERIAAYIAADVVIGAAMFNLGYLPGSDKRIATSPDTTLPALGAIFDRLRTGGLVTVVLYTGHPGGLAEAEAVKTAVAALPPCFESALWTRLATKMPAPELLVVGRITQPAV